MTASSEALTIAGPAVRFIGVSVLGRLFGNASTIPISVASLVMNLIQVPATFLLLSSGTAQENKASNESSLRPAGVSSRVAPTGGMGGGMISIAN